MRSPYPPPLSPPAKPTNFVLVGCLASCGSCGLLLVLLVVIGSLGTFRPMKLDAVTAQVPATIVAAEEPKFTQERLAANGKPLMDLLESHQEQGDGSRYVLQMRNL